MSDIKKGYTFTDKSTDWVSNKETAIRLNKMLDDAKLNLVAGTNISITPTPNGPSIAATGATGTVTAVTGTLPILSSGGTAPAISINAATTSTPGSMSAADKTKLDGIEAGAQVNVATNLAYTDSTRVLTSSTGTDVTLPLVGADPGLMTSADKTKLDGIAAGAQVNVATNLAQGTRTTTSVPVTSSTGTTATLDVATTSLAGVMSSADKAKLDGIAANANNYSLPKATSTVLGGVELFDDTVQSVAANAVTTTAARTYGVQLNNNDQMVVNVPWIDSTFAAQTAKTFFAGPASSPSATPTFRVIASTDLPAFGSGDVSFAVAGGAGTIASNVIYNANINSGAAIDYSKLAALNSTNILVGSSANVATSTAVTGDVTISNTGVTTIGADKVTNSQLANMGATTVKVNATTSTADPTDLSVGTNTVVGRVAGDIVAAKVVTDQIADNAVTFAKLQDGVANTVLARAAATNGDVAGVALAASQLLGRGPAGDITAISLGSNLSITGTTLDSTGSGGGIADGATLTTGLTFPVSGLHILDTDASHDLIISPGGDLTADRTLTLTTGDANRTITLTGDTSLSGTNTGDNATNTQYSGLVSNANHTGDATGSTALTISNGAVTLAKMANLAANSFIANNTGTAATPIAVTTTQATAMLNQALGDAGAGGTKGLVPAPAIGDAAKFLRGDMTYQTISGGGNALTSNPLSQFATTTSLQLAGVISDETGTDKLVFNTSPTLVTPLLGTPTSGLLNSCTSNPNATGAVERTFQAKAGDVFNVKDFGAVGDGSTTDTTAISNAIAAAIAAPSGGAVFFPRGTYLTARQTISSPGKNIRIFGEGEASQINSTSAAGVLEFIDTGNLACFAVTDIRLMSNFGGVALKFNCNPATARHDRNLVYVDRVTATCFSLSVNWTAGIQLSRAHNAIISNSIFDNLSQVLTSGDVGLEILEFSVAVLVTNCNFSFWNYGVRCEVYQEGLLFSNCVFVPVKYGAVYSVASNVLRITSIQYVNCNFDARGAGNHAIFCNNVQGLLLSNNYFIGGVSEFANLFLRQVQFSTITGNKFFTSGDDAIQLLTSSPAVTTPVGGLFPATPLPVACSAVAITGNTFFGDAVSVRVGVNCVNIVVQNNVRSRGDGTNTAPFQQSTMEPVTLNTVNSAGGTSDQNYIQP